MLAAAAHTVVQIAVQAAHLLAIVIAPATQTPPFG